MRYQPVLTVLAYVVDAAGEHVLMVHRTARPDDDQLGLWNGLGGKVDPGESLTDALRRELREEASIEVGEHELRGTLNWPGFGGDGSDWFAAVFLVTAFTGVVPARNVEGELRWVPLAELGTLDLFEGDRHFLPLVFDAGVRQFHGVLGYAGRRLSSVHIDVVR